MKKIIFAFPGNELLAKSIASGVDADIGEAILRHFPDGESYVRIISEVQEKEVLILCTLHEPDEKLLPLFFFCKTLRDAKAGRITLISPYLAYMRQDKQFNSGEALTSKYFASLLSMFIDELITIDPHLHRTISLDEIYSVPASVLHAKDLIANYIKNKIDQPLLIGPDSESKQWVSEVAMHAHAPFVILQKERFGDKTVKVSAPHIEKYENHTPVLIDDIVSSGHTMIETINQLKKIVTNPPVCIAIHAVFADEALDKIKNAGAKEVVSCNTIKHQTNQIDICGLIIKALTGQNKLTNS